MPQYQLSKISEFPAVGGPDESRINEAMKKHGYGSTSKGIFTVHKIESHRSYGRWANSSVPWETETKIDTGNIVKVKMSGSWVKLSSLPGWNLPTEKNVYDKLIANYDNLFDQGVIGTIKGFLRVDRKALLNLMNAEYLSNSPSGKEIPKLWMLNDFGHKAIKYYKDADHDGRKDKGEKLRAQFMHSSPHTEIWTDLGSTIQTSFFDAVRHIARDKTNFAQRFENDLLQYSHGCIHLFPNHVDSMISNGYIKKSSIVVVHPYDESSKSTYTVDRHRTLDYEVHFFPKDTKVVVYKTSRV